VTIVNLSGISETNSTCRVSYADTQSGSHEMNT